MQRILLKTLIDASVCECFDLSRNIDLHVQSMMSSNEKAVAGITNGFIDLGESVTWEARHFGFKLKLTSKITEMEKPLYFIDEMIRGPFKFMKHQHHFNEIDNQTEMTDIFEFEAPFGLPGWFVEQFLLKSYMRKLLIKRNIMIKKAAETKKS